MKEFKFSFSHGLSALSTLPKPPKPALPAEELDTDFKKMYPPDPLGEELGDNARVWKVYRGEATKADAVMLDGWNKTLDILLVFAGLFSAVVTAFVGQSNTQLQPDSNAYVANALFHLVALNGSVHTLPAPPSLDAAPKSTVVWVNALWFTSLLLSLAVAFLCILAKQWTGEYIARTTSSTTNTNDWCRRRAFYFRGLDTWGLPAFLSFLPVLLHISLFLFIAGLCLSIWAVNQIIALCLISVGGCLAVFYAIATLVPIWRPDCPTALPLIGRLRAAPLVVLRPSLAICICCFPAARKAFQMLRRYMLWPVYDACINILLTVRRGNVSISRHFSDHAIPFHLTFFDEERQAMSGSSDFPRVPRGLREKTFRDAPWTRYKDVLDAEALRWLILNCSDHDTVAVGYQALGAVVHGSPLAEYIDIDHALRTAISFETACTYTSTAASRSPTEIMRILRSMLFICPPVYRYPFRIPRYSWIAPLDGVDYPDMVLVCRWKPFAREEVEKVTLPFSAIAPSPTIQSTLALIFHIPSVPIDDFCRLLLGASKDTLSRHRGYIARRLCKGGRGCLHPPFHCYAPLHCLSEALCSAIHRPDPWFTLDGIIPIALRTKVALRLLSLCPGDPDLFDRPHLLSCLASERFTSCLHDFSTFKFIAAPLGAPVHWRFEDLAHCIKAITGLAKLCRQFASEAQQDHALAPELKNLIDHILIYVVFLAADSQPHWTLEFVPPALEMFSEQPRRRSPRLIHADTTLTTDFVARAPWTDIFALLPWASPYRLEIACFVIGALCSKDGTDRWALRQLDYSLVHLLQDGQSTAKGRDLLCHFACHRIQLGGDGWASDADALEAGGVAHVAGEITRDVLFLGPCAECSGHGDHQRWEPETEDYLIGVCQRIGVRFVVRYRAGDNFSNARDKHGLMLLPDPDVQELIVLGGMMDAV